jgi:HSP20 family molecular chaperone IbpA
MRSFNDAAGDSSVGRRIQYDDGVVVCLDLPYPDESVSVDVVGTRAIVVVDDDGESVQAEFDLPGPAESIDLNNGVLTIKINQ